ncbi:PLP-dependent transferase [Rothia kristinae]|uniref:homocysteine desulfhydrase n=1 Tax=Rothia kristinae TaxID=37923 RepID=A0A7T4T3Y4_9MICC|nr:PLP-dependent aspartate aminotransferase family protein [Rothia kristinae]QQC58878.1 PLP-dependent transferase [Rothia kristinae]
MAGITTRTIHALHDVEQGGVVPPIYTASTFLQPTAGGEGEYEYQRGANPTRTALERTLAALEGARHAFAFATGMAATSAAMGLLRTGDSIIMSLPVYGGNYRFATIELPQRGIGHRFVTDLNELTDEDFDDSVKMVFIETPANPTLRVTDIARVAELAHRHGAYVVVDNTFLTPYLQRPLALGADVVVQSATKYLAGHGDLLGGVVTTDDDAVAARMAQSQLVSGAVLSPIDSYRLLQDVKTLAVRMDRQLDNARKVIAAMEAHPAVAKVHMPGSHSEREAEIQARQADGLGAVFSMELAEGKDVRAFLGALRVWGFAVSLGGIESLICLPAHMTHGAYTDEHREAALIPEELLRVAVGIEDAEDLIADLTQALEAA